MNQYFLNDLDLRRGYTQRLPALRKLIKILYPYHSENEIFEVRHSCDEVNDAIDKYIINMLGKATSDLCLDEFAKMFGDGKVNTVDTITFKQLLDEMMKHKELLRKNIEERCI